MSRFQRRQIERRSEGTQLSRPSPPSGFNHLHYSGITPFLWTSVDKNVRFYTILAWFAGLICGLSW